MIFLNEMDIGMARSHQQHTTKLLAYALGMNYAWGLEFVELTLGDAGEQKANAGDDDKSTKLKHNFQGLHGNAILSKCPIHNATIIRDPIGDYFDPKPNKVNANGMERRLGGRMILLATIRTNIMEEQKNNDATTTTETEQAVVVGSVHKLNVASSWNKVNEYIHSVSSSSSSSTSSSSPGVKVVMGGDQRPERVPLDKLQLENVGSSHTWSATCTSLGRLRGDTFFVSPDWKVVDEFVRHPCVSVVKQQFNISLGDHALIGATLLWS